MEINGINFEQQSLMDEFEEEYSESAFNVADMEAKCMSVINKHDNILVSVSGGSDSDILIDLFERLSPGKAKYIFFNTGSEWKSTIKHLRYLENKYSIKIIKAAPIKTIAESCEINGEPVFSKRISEMLNRLQIHNFDFKNADSMTLEEAKVFYRNKAKENGLVSCDGALDWFYNGHVDPVTNDGKKYNSSFSIKRKKWLREFLIANPPTFKISAKCCQYAKKDVIKNFLVKSIMDFENGMPDAVNYDLNVNGMRRSEGGSRSTKIKGCFDFGDKLDVKTKNKGLIYKSVDSYRPLFWLSDEDKNYYNEKYKIKNSDCYEVMGMKRTGCAGCPFGRNLEQERQLMKEYDSVLNNRVTSMFKNAYTYHELYNEFRFRMDNEGE